MSTPTTRQSRYTTEIGGPRSTHGISSLIAFRILLTWPNRDPTHTELRDTFGMSKATANRWLASLREARGAKPIKPN